ncbi:hypothetical protein GC170_17955 [bacterium]|nr:hypothetical protein [bacterium]
MSHNQFGDLSQGSDDEDRDRFGVKSVIFAFSKMLIRFGFSDFIDKSELYADKGNDGRPIARACRIGSSG